VTGVQTCALPISGKLAGSRNSVDRRPVESVTSRTPARIATITFCDAMIPSGFRLVPRNAVQGIERHGTRSCAPIWSRRIPRSCGIATCSSRRSKRLFKCLKSEFGIRPVYHQLEHRVEAHILVAFLAYCLSVTLQHRWQAHAPGLTPRAVLYKPASIQMLDVSFPTTDGRYLTMPSYTEPADDVALLLHHLKLTLPGQPHPRIAALSGDG